MLPGAACLQVQKGRLQKACHLAWPADQAPTTAPQAVPTSFREIGATSPERHQQTRHSSHAPKPVEEFDEGEATPHDCKTPHHSMLPAPGAHMLSEAGHARTASAPSSADACAGQEDPIMVTAGHTNRHSNQSMPPRRRPRSKTWNTLNFQQAPNAPQQTTHVSLASNPAPVASSSAPLPAAAMDQHHPLHGTECDVALDPSHDATGCPIAHAQHGKHCYFGRTQHSHGHQSTASMPSSPPGTPMSPGISRLGDACHQLQPALPADRSTQPGAALAAAAQTCTGLEGSETQPDPHFAQAAHDPGCIGTPLASVLRPLGSVPNLQPGLMASQAGLLHADGTSPACENIPDSSGNTSAPGGAHPMGGSKSDLSASACEEVRTVTNRSSQDEHGWHVQLDSPVISLIAQGR